MDFKDWRTTVAGILAGGLHLWTAGASPKSVLASISLALIGLLAKDSGAGLKG